MAPQTFGKLLTFHIVLDSLSVIGERLRDSVSSLQILQTAANQLFARRARRNDYRFVCILLAGAMQSMLVCMDKEQKPRM